MMTRFRMAVASAMALAAIFAAAPTHGQAPGYNVVIIQIDDMDVSAMNEAISRGLMPATKKYFRERGAYFPNSFTVGTLGGASRAATLMGQYPMNNGEIGSHALFGDVVKFNEASSVAVWTQNAGYINGNDGRYIPGWGHCDSWWPLFCNPPYKPAGWDYWVGPIDHTTWSVTDYKLWANGQTIDFKPLNAMTANVFHQIDVLGSVAKDFLEKVPALNQKFTFWFTPVAYNREMLIVPSYNVCPDPKDPGYSFYGGSYWGVSQRPANRHLRTVWNNLALNGKALAQASYPMPMPPSFNEADVSDKPNWLQLTPLMTAANIDCLQKRYWRRLELLRTLDDSVGAIMTTLEATGQLANTMVILTADNGMGDGQHRFPEKGTGFEESIRVPLWVYTPWNTQPRTITQMVMNIDIAPTIAELTGAAPTHEPDGRSFLPLLRGESVEWRKGMLFQHKNSAQGDKAAPDFFMLRTERYKLTRYDGVTAGVTGEFYDLQTDPYELNNLWLQPATPERVLLEAWLTEFKTCAGLTCKQSDMGLLPPSLQLIR